MNVRTASTKATKMRSGSSRLTREEISQRPAAVKVASMNDLKVNQRSL